MANFPKIIAIIVAFGDVVHEGQRKSPFTMQGGRR
jgi:hypothetical protein